MSWYAQVQKAIEEDRDLPNLNEISWPSNDHLIELLNQLIIDHGYSKVIAQVAEWLHQYRKMSKEDIIESAFYHGNEALARAFGASESEIMDWHTASSMTNLIRAAMKSQDPHSSRWATLEQVMKIFLHGGYSFRLYGVYKNVLEMIANYLQTGTSDWKLWAPSIRFLIENVGLDPRDGYDAPLGLAWAGHKTDLEQFMSNVFKQKCARKVNNMLILSAQRIHQGEMACGKKMKMLPVDLIKRIVYQALVFELWDNIDQCTLIPEKLVGLAHLFKIPFELRCCSSCSRKDLCQRVQEKVQKMLL